MRRIHGGRQLAVCVILTAVLLSAPAAGADEGAGSAGALEHLGTTEVSPRLEELRFRTPALAHETRVRVLLPAGYDDDPGRRYPVLYLLHGGTGSYRDWTVSGNAEALTAGYPLIVVMPDASGYGGYVDWWNFGAGGPPMWETYHVSQLVPWIDSHYRTVARRDGRAIAGLSMGGGGAMHYASRHPDLFTAAAAFSGAVDTNTLPVQMLIQTAGLEEGHPPGAELGLRATDEIRWRGHNPWDLADNLEGMLLQLDTGNGLPGGPGGDAGDPIEMAVHQMMSNLHARLVSLGYPHIWNDYGPGGHTWFYWQRDLSELLPRLMERFADPPPPPSPFSYETIDTEYDIWGWHVDVDRPALELSRLLDAGPHGFRLAGSGSAEVRTAPLFEPGSTVAVAVADAGGRQERSVVADADGTITVAVSLGPGNPYQQLSPQGNVWALATGAALGQWPAVTATVAFEPAPSAVAGAAPASSTDASADEVLPAVAQPAVPAEAGDELPATGGTSGSEQVVAGLLALAALGIVRLGALR